MRKIRELLQEMMWNTKQYAPWLDSEYAELYKQAELRISKKRAYILIQILQLAILQDGNVIEMGVYKGCTAYMICWILHKKNINKKIYLCDTFQGTPRRRYAEKGDRNRAGQYADTSLTYVKNKLKIFSEKSVFIPGLIPNSLMKIPQNEKFCFAHVHLNLYKSTIDALEYLFTRISEKGIIVIEDYGIKGCAGVRAAADEFCKKHDLQPVFLGSEQLVIFM